jgi:nitrogen regulatory protein P-II 1
MKRIDAIIRPENLNTVKERLVHIGIGGFALTEIIGFGRQRGRAYYRGSEYTVDAFPKLLMTIITTDEQVSEIVDAITKGARTGAFGDGKIFVSALEEVVRIRTGEIDRAAA